VRNCLGNWDPSELARASLDGATYLESCGAPSMTHVGGGQAVRHRSHREFIPEMPRSVLQELDPVEDNRDGRRRGSGRDRQ
jgi:hypothetical protein